MLILIFKQQKKDEFNVNSKSRIPDVAVVVYCAVELIRREKHGMRSELFFQNRQLRFIFINANISTTHTARASEG